MRLLNLEELKEVGGGYVWPDNTDAYWEWFYSQSPEEQQRILAEQEAGAAAGDRGPNFDDGGFYESPFDRNNKFD